MTMKKVLFIVSAFALHETYCFPVVFKSFRIERNIKMNLNENPTSLKHEVVHSMKRFIALTSSVSSAYLLRNKVQAISVEEENKLYGVKTFLTDDGLYTDLDNRFSVTLPAGWVKYPRPPVKLRVNELLLKDIKFADTILAAKNFAEGTILSVTRSDAVRLLKDFNVEWWYAPLSKLTDLGPPKLIAELLVEQRELGSQDIGDYERKASLSVISGARIEGDALYFKVSTPIVNKFGEQVGMAVTSDAVVKAYFKDNSITTVWLQALPSVFEGDYSENIDQILQSFILL